MLGIMIIIFFLTNYDYYDCYFNGHLLLVTQEGVRTSIKLITCFADHLFCTSPTYSLFSFVFLSIHISTYFFHFYRSFNSMYVNPVFFFVTYTYMLILYNQLYNF